MISRAIGATARSRPTTNPRRALPANWYRWKFTEEPLFNDLLAYTTPSITQRVLAIPAKPAWIMLSVTPHSKTEDVALQARCLHKQMVVLAESRPQFHREHIDQARRIQNVRLSSH